MNPLYQMLNGQISGGMQMPRAPMSTGPMFQNPVQKANYIMQAMTNPAAFVKQHFPDIPDSISNDPNQILGYLQRTRGISNEQIQQLQNQIPRW